MALKFRRGTTAQQSGSLAYGEPYVNTDLGTLLVGGASGDIQLSNTGPTSTFAGASVSASTFVSASTLKVTGNASIDGNLTLGGAITIGDATADTVNVIASLSSSLIPQTTNAFDLGSATKVWRDLYISTGSIKFVEGTTVVKTLSPTTLTALESKTGSYASTGSNSFSGTQTITGSINVKDSAGTFAIVGNGFSEIYLQSNGGMLLQAGGSGVQIKSNNLAVDNNLTVGGYVSGEIRANNGVVSGSSQITYASISSIPAGIVSGSTQVTPLLPTGVVSGSAQTIANLPTGVVSGSSQTIANLPTGTISGSSQLSGTTITNLTVTNLTTVNETASVIFSSGSNRFGDFGDDVHDFTGSVKISGSQTIIGSSTATSYNGTINATNGVVSGSSQIVGSSITTNAITIAGTSTALGGAITAEQIRTAIGTVVTGSSQITGISNAQLTNSSISIAGTSTALGSSITAEQIRTAIGTVVTGSSQIVGSSITTNTVTVGSTAIALGGSATTIAGLSSVTSTGFTGALTGNASTATTLQTARTINGTSFNGSADITIANLVSGSSQITLSSTTGYGTVINQNLLTTSNVQHASLGIGMAASGTSGRIDAANDVVAFSSSDIRFKENIKPIENALDKISNISGNTYDWKAENKAEHGYEGNDVGVIAQEIEEVLPQLVQTRENGYKAVKYDKLVALLIEGIKEQQLTISKLELEVNGLQNVITVFEDRMKEKGLL